MAIIGPRAAFVGSARFEILGRIGAGGMGAVYEVFDRDREERIALKTVGFADGQALLRFKREFRELRDLQHPNLVRLGELFEIEGQWSYTMELVAGDDFATYVSGARRSNAPTEAIPTRASLPSAATDTDVRAAQALTHGERAPVHRSALPPFDEARLRQSLAQLADGLSALHAAQKVHRDIKPANVLVERATRRVVLLDFGLVTDISSGQQKTDVGAMGTVAYMAPEQASGRPVDARADWYSVGAMLFEAMVGRPPFEITCVADLARKVTQEAPDAASIAPHLPPDLVELCGLLLRRDPAERPTERRILEMLSVRREEAPRAAWRTQSTHVGEGHFVGRARELEFLREQLASVSRGAPRSVVIRGEIGIGKTHLVRCSLSRARDEARSLLTLQGRCTQHESVPYKGLDGVVDGLSSYLARLPHPEADLLVPEKIDVLARTFPVLRRVSAFGAPGPTDIRDPREQRAVVFTSLRRLLARVAQRVPTIVWIDDAQWIDEDSAALLGELLRLPDAPPVLFLATERVEPGASGRVSRLGAIGEAIEAHVLDLPRLELDEATALAARRLGEGEGVLGAWSAKIGRESLGHPLFVDELARYVELASPEVSESLSLEVAIRARIEHAGAEAREVLRLVVVADGAVERRVVAAALDVSQGMLDKSLSVLGVLRLVRSEGATPTSRIEPFHGMIAAAVFSSLSDSERGELHGRIARAMESLGGSDPVEQARHWAAAGELRRAAECYSMAADEAARALAFDRAAELLRKSIELEPSDGPGLENRRVRLAQALANAGRGLDSGEVYEQAASAAPTAHAIELRRLSAEQFMLSGHIERGISGFRAILKALGLRYPGSRFISFLSIAWTRLVLLLRGYKFRARDASLLEPSEQLATDVCRSASLCLLHTDTILGFDFQGRALLRALRMGEPERIAILLANEAATFVSANRRKRARLSAVLEQARAIAALANSPYARGACAYAEGMSLYLMGEWRQALEVLAGAERIFRDECPNMPAELRTMQAAIVQCLWEAGEWKALRDRLSRAVKEASERGDLFTEATFRAGFSQRTRCVDDTAVGGIEDATRAMSAWSGPDYGVQNWLNVVHGAFATDFVGPPGEGYLRLEREHPKARSSLLFTVQLMRAGYQLERALRAVHRALAEPAERRHLLSLAVRVARKLEREDAPWAQAGGHHVRGCAHAVAGEVVEAAVQMQIAIDAYNTAGMRGHAAALRWAKGRVVGGAEGDKLVAGARAYFEAQGVMRPERLAMTIAPVRLVQDDAPAGP